MSGISAQIRTISLQDTAPSLGASERIAYADPIRLDRDPKGTKDILARTDGYKSSWPVCRMGAVIASDVHFTAAQARTLAQALKEQDEAIAVRLAAMLRSMKAEPIGVFEEDEPDIKLDGNPIVDFRNLTFRVRNMKIVLRTCITVCAANRFSKVWVRLALAKIDSRDPLALSASEAASFSEECDRFGAVMLKELKTLYRATIKGVAPVSHFRTAHTLLVKAIDLPSAEAEDLLSSLVFGERLSLAIKDKRRLEVWRHFSKSLSCKKHAERIGSVKHPRERVGTIEPWIISASPTARAFFLANITQKKSEFWGFAPDLRESAVEGKFFHHGLSFQLTAALITRVARRL